VVSVSLRARGAMYRRPHNNPGLIVRVADGASSFCRGGERAVEEGKKTGQTDRILVSFVSAGEEPPERLEEPDPRLCAEWGNHFLAVQ
jgi:hypothetical protein